MMCLLAFNPPTVSKCHCHLQQSPCTSGWPALSLQHLKRRHKDTGSSVPHPQQLQATFSLVLLEVGDLRGTSWAHHSPSANSLQWAACRMCILVIQFLLPKLGKGRVPDRLIGEACLLLWISSWMGKAIFYSGTWWRKEHEDSWSAHNVSSYWAKPLLWCYSISGWDHPGKTPRSS